MRDLILQLSKSSIYSTKPLPGYVYVNVKPQTWVAGDSALKNPARIVPLEIQERARDNMQQQQRSTKGVTANGVTGSSF